MFKLHLIIIMCLLISLPACAEFKNVTAKDIVDELIKNDKYSKDNLIITGNLNLNPSRSKNSFSSIQITNSIFIGEVTITDTIFRDSANFHNTTFQKAAQFKNTNIERTKFEGCNFRELANFEKSKFNYTNMNKAVFHKYANFLDTRFLFDMATFNDAKFEDTALFINSSFNNAYFVNTSFESPDFYSANIENAHFEKVKINETTNLDNTTINVTSFKKVQFGGNVLFRDANITKSLIINGCQFKGDAIFDGTQFKASSILNLNSTQFNKLYIKWSDINKVLVYNDEAYLLLIDNYKNLGLFEDANNCYFQYRTERRNKRNLDFFSFGSDLFLEKTYGYGTKPLSVLWVSAIAIAVFSFLFILIGFPGQKSEEMRDDAETSLEKGFYYMKIIWWYIKFSFLTFLSGTKLFVDAPPCPNMKGCRNNLFRFFYTFERVLGGVLFGFFALALAKTIILQDI